MARAHTRSHTHARHARPLHTLRHERTSQAAAAAAASPQRTTRCIHGRNRRRAKVKRARAHQLHRVLYLSHQMRAKVCCPVCPLHFILILYACCCCYSSSKYCTIPCVALPFFSVASYSYRPILLAF